jgi:phospho-N-acetylmuramoyl-pentapeptide-transferase
MLYHLLYPLRESYTFLNVFQYITFRTIMAALTAMAISFLLGPWMIERLRVLKYGQAIRQEGPKAHLSKAGTPTMGGLLILFSIVISTLLWAKLDNRLVLYALFITVTYGIIGFLDDYLKIKKKSSEGLRGKKKMALQILFASFVAVALYWEATRDVVEPIYNLHLTVPFFKELTPDLGWLYIPFAMLVIVGASNAVNLTDGLDGLATGPVITTAATYLVFAYVAGHYVIARYLNILYSPATGELAVFCAAMIGAGIGFLWFNTYPAQVFMGDVGSLALGGALGTVAVLVKQEIVLVVVGGIFVVETLSVMLQVFWFKRTGKRIFRMSPIHHHFELLGWPEPKIIVRFWIISFILALLALSTLKLR